MIDKLIDLQGTGFYSSDVDTARKILNNVEYEITKTE